MVVFGQKWLYLGKVVVFLYYSSKAVLFGQRGCTRVTVVVQPILPENNKVVVFGKRGCILAKWMYSGKNGCIQANGCFQAKVILFGHGGCIRIKNIFIREKK